jgi:uncharacterized phage-associated protein
MAAVKYDPRKFQELVVYVAEQTADDPSFGDTNLHKVLYFSDFFGYVSLGAPLTGARYQKGKYGPTARPLLPARAALERKGDVRVESRQIGDSSQRVTRAERSANRDLFTDEELELVDDVIQRLRGRSAVSVSALSHRESPGWNLVGMGEDIPYSTALISREAPSEETLARGRERAARLGW